jgi:hypothetical protein
MAAASGKVVLGSSRRVGCLDSERERVRLIWSSPSFENDQKGFFRVHFDCCEFIIDGPVLKNQAAI